MDSTLTNTAPAPPTRARSLRERSLVAVLVFQGLSGVLGGVMLVTQPTGDDAWFPAAWLDDIPFASWTWPALILGVGLGVSALVLAYGVRQHPRWSALAFVERATRHHWSWIGAVGLGVGLMAWIVVQRALIAGTTWLQPFYFAVGLAILALALTRDVRAALRSPR